MDAVALVATIGGSAVALASIGANVLIARTQRRQAVELAGAQHVHERELARGDRLYNRRAPVYESMMRIVQPTMEHVEARDPIVAIHPPPPLPPEPSVDDQRAMLIELRTHGSPDVADAFQKVTERVRWFLLAATTLETVLAQGAQLSNEREQVSRTREEARAAAEQLQRLVSGELAGL